MPKELSAMSKGKQQTKTKKQLKADIALGQRKYVLYRGVIGWGTPSFLLYLVLTVIAQLLFGGLSFAQGIKSLFPFTIVFGFIIFSITGVILGNVRWKQLLKEAGGKYTPKPKETK